MNMKPMLKYSGGKAKEIPNILPYIPEFDGRYVEPFFGGGAMYFHLEPKKAIINDINTKLIDFYKAVKCNFNPLRKELDEVELLYSKNQKEFDELRMENPNEKIINKNEDMYYRMRSMFNGISPKEYSDALLYYYINKTAYSGMIRYNSKGEFNVPFGRYATLNTKSVTLSHSKLLESTEIYNTNYFDIFNMCNSGDFVFLDPPYDCVFSDYGNKEYKDGFNEDNHRKLSEDFKNLPCKAMMVIGKTPLTEELYGNNIVDEYKKNYSVNIRNRFKSDAIHIIVTNWHR